MNSTTILTCEISTACMREIGFFVLQSHLLCAISVYWSIMHKESVINVSIKSKKDVMLNKHCTRQVWISFRVALAVQTFATREELIK